MTTHFLKDILRQPTEMQKAISLLGGAKRASLDQAAEAVRNAKHIYMTGIGASWHATVSAGSLFQAGGIPVQRIDTAEMLHFTALPQNATIIVLSRSGRSVEIVKLLEKARSSNTTIIAITNAPDQPLAQHSQIPIVIPAKRDHGISVNTYSTLSLAAGLLASTVLGNLNPQLLNTLSNAVQEAGNQIPAWQEKLEGSDWFVPRVPYYFLGRGAALGSAGEAALMWEEGAKTAATSLGTGTFRHGPQEIVRKGIRFAIWVDAEKMRAEDLAVADDLRKLGASTLLIGQALPEKAADVVLQLPKIPAAWQFLTEVFPIQLAAEYFSRVSGADCDSFRVCSFVVESEHGLLAPGQALPKD